MKAVICSKIGEPEDLTVGQLPDPEMQPSSVRVGVHASALNFPDILMSQGKYQYKPDLPFSPGMECVGEVLEVAPDVTGFEIGQRVVAHPWFGCFAEQVISPVEFTFPIPDGLSDIDAAGFALTYGTGYYALVNRGNLQPGETLLVLGAAGGVGLAAVELGKALGARVIAAASTDEKLAVCKKYGADDLINYTDQPLKEAVRALTGDKGADVIYDPVGGDMTDAAMRCINWEGRLLIIGFAGGRIAQVPVNLSLLKGCQIVGVAYQRFNRSNPAGAAENMAALMELWSAGKLRPHTSAIFPMDDAVGAMQAIMTRKSTGQVVVKMRDD